MLPGDRISFMIAKLKKVTKYLDLPFLVNYNRKWLMSQRSHVILEIIVSYTHANDFGKRIEDFF
jgi:hypothetical protein